MTPVLSPILRRSLVRQSTIITRLQPAPVRTLSRIPQRRHTVNHSTPSVAPRLHKDMDHREITRQLQRLDDRLDDKLIDRLMSKDELESRLNAMEQNILGMPQSMSRYDLERRFQRVDEELSKLILGQHKERLATESREDRERDEREEKTEKLRKRTEVMFYSSALLTGILLNRYYGKLTE